MGLTLALRSSCWNSGCGQRPWFFTKAGTSGAAGSVVHGAWISMYLFRMLKNFSFPWKGEVVSILVK